MSEQDVDKLELLAEAFNGLVRVGEDVFKDGKVDLSDLDQLKPLGENVQKLVKAVKAHKEMFAEAKDIDPMEAVKIVQKLLA